MGGSDKLITVHTHEAKDYSHGVEAIAIQKTAQFSLDNGTAVSADLTRTSVDKNPSIATLSFKVGDVSYSTDNPALTDIIGRALDSGTLTPADTKAMGKILLDIGGDGDKMKKDIAAFADTLKAEGKAGDNQVMVATKVDSSGSHSTARIKLDDGKTMYVSSEILPKGKNNTYISVSEPIGSDQSVLALTLPMGNDTAYVTVGDDANAVARELPKITDKGTETELTKDVQAAVQTLFKDKVLTQTEAGGLQIVFDEIQHNDIAKAISDAKTLASGGVVTKGKTGRDGR